MSLSIALNNALTGLRSASSQADIIANNVSNALTEDYGRREAVLSATVVGGQGGGVLSILMLPLCIPVLIFGSRATDLAVSGEAVTGPLLLLAAMRIFAISLAPLAIAAAVRVSID